MYILTMIIIFYSSNVIATEQIKTEYSSQALCETAAKENTRSLSRTDEGKILMVTCTAK